MYLPLRSTFVTLRPATRSVNSLRLPWRRIARIAFFAALTSTVLMRLPTTSFSRSRRITSTSGSSTSSPFLRRGRPIGAGQRVERLPRGALLGLLLRPALAAPEGVRAQEDDGGELLR